MVLADVFGVETTESISAAQTLMDNFGLTSQQAFDFLASGFQQGMDRSGDFIDSIGEYATQFSNGGATAEQFFSIMKSGLQGGMLGTDKAADAFKEFRVRIQDGSKLTAESLKMIGINSDQLAAKMASGQITAAQAFQLVVDKLGDLDDETIRMQAGVGLLGTQFEDLGQSGALGLSMTTAKMEDLAGATDSLRVKYKDWGSLFQGVWRQALVAIEPLGSRLLDIANSAMPAVTAGIEMFRQGLSMAIDSVIRLGDLLAAGDMTGVFDLVSSGFSQLFAVAGPALTEFGAFLVEQANQWGTAFIGWVEPQIPIMLGQLANLGDAVATWLVTQAPIWSAQVAEWATAFMAWVGPAIPVVLTQLAQLGAAVSGWIAGQAVEWASQIGQGLLAAFPALQGIVPVVEAVTSAISTLVSGGLALLAEGWALVQPALLAFATNGELVKSVLLGIGTALAAFTIITTVVGWVTTLGAAFAAASVAIPTAGAALAAVVAVLGGPVTIAIAAVSAAIGLLAVAWQRNWGDIQGKTQAAITAISGFISSARASWESWWTAHGEKVKAVFSTAWEGIKSLVDGALKGLQTLMSAFQSAREGDWRAFGQKLRTIWDDLWASIKRALEIAIPALIRLIKEFAEDIINSFTSVDWGKIGNDIIAGIAKGVSNAAQGLIDAAVGAAQAAMSAVTGFLDSRSPSRRAANEIGLPFVQGMAMGITDNLSLIQSAAQQAGQMALANGSLMTPAFAGARAGVGMPTFGDAGSSLFPSLPAPTSSAPIINVIVHANINSELDVEETAYRIAGEIGRRL